MPPTAAASAASCAASSCRREEMLSPAVRFCVTARMSLPSSLYLTTSTLHEDSRVSVWEVLPQMRS
jgi:hypothetical protein